MAGLSAARTLTEHGVRVTLIEARDRVGGRIRTILSGPGQMPTELGPEFVHGRPPEIFELVEADGIELMEVIEPHVRLRGGKVVRDDDFLERVGRALEIDLDGPDLSVTALLARNRITGHERTGVLAYVEGFHAADPDRVSAQSLARAGASSEALHADAVYTLPGGYQTIVDALDRRIDRRLARFVLGARADEVTWKRGEAIVRVGSVLHRGDALVVALPLGVLQAHAVRFSPPLWPRASAIAAQAMGHVLRFTVRLKAPVWHESAVDEVRRGFHFLFTDDEALPTFWRRGDAHSIVAWCGASRADRLPLDPHERRTLVIEKLAAALAVPGERAHAMVEDVLWHDWQADPLCRGAYSYALVGGEWAPAALATPLDDTLVFAGEHCDTSSQTGTVHGAIASGRRAAVALL